MNLLHSLDRSIFPAELPAISLSKRESLTLSFEASFSNLERHRERSGVGTWVCLNLLVFCASTRFTRFNHFTRFRIHCTCICGSSGVIKPLETIGSATAKSTPSAELTFPILPGYCELQDFATRPLSSHPAVAVVDRHPLKFLEEARLFGRGIKLDQISIDLMIYPVLTERYRMRSGTFRN